MKSSGTKWLADRTRELPSRPLYVTKIREKALGTKDAIRLTSGEPDFATPGHIREAAKKALDEGYTFYTSARGLPEFREAVSENMREEQGVDIDPNLEVMATCGGIEGIFLALASIINPGDEVIIPDPGYISYEAIVSFVGGRSVPVPLQAEQDFRLDPAEIEKRVTSRTKMLILNSPSNPTGMVMTDKDLDAVAEVARRHDLLILSDEAYDKIVYDGIKHRSIIELPEMKERTIVVKSFSKTYAMTGWRIGYLIGDGKIIEELSKVQTYIVLSVSAAVQKAAVAALKGPQDSVREMVKEFEARRALTIDRLNRIEKITCSMPKGAFYAFPEISKLGIKSYDLTELLLNKAKVAVYPGIGYGERGEGYVRISFATSRAKLQEGLDRVEKAVAKL